MEKIELFRYPDYLSFLHDVTKQRSVRMRPRTLGQWARKLGYRSPRSFAMVLGGKRLPSQEMRIRLSRALALGREESLYFDLLVALERHQRRGLATEPIIKQLERINPNIPGETLLSGPEFSSLCPWHYFVLWQLVGTPSFKENLTWIQNRMRRKVTALEITTALSTLINLGLITRDPDTHRLKMVQTFLKTSTDVPSRAIRLHHRQMLQRSVDALEEQSVGNREITSVTFRMHPSRMDEAKAQIRAFRDLFHKEFGSEVGEEVWQFNIQLFSHTKKTDNRAAR